MEVRTPPSSSCQWTTFFTWHQTASEDTCRTDKDGAEESIKVSGPPGEIELTLSTQVGLTLSAVKAALTETMFDFVASLTLAAGAVTALPHMIRQDDTAGLNQRGIFSTGGS